MKEIISEMKDTVAFESANNGPFGSLRRDTRSLGLPSDLHSLSGSLWRWEDFGTTILRIRKQHVTFENPPRSLPCNSDEGVVLNLYYWSQRIKFVHVHTRISPARSSQREAQLVSALVPKPTNTHNYSVQAISSLQFYA